MHSLKTSWLAQVFILISVSISRCERTGFTNSTTKFLEKLNSTTTSSFTDVTRTRDSNSTTVLTSTAATTGNIVSTAALKTTYRAKNSTSTSTSPITAINTTVATSQLPVNPQTTAAAYVDNYAPDGSDYNYTYEYGSGDGNTSGGGDDEDYELPISPDEDYNTFSIEERIANEKEKNSISSSDWFKCDNNSLGVNKQKVCDGVRDCFDCSDESSCPTTGDNFFYCYGKGHNLTEFAAYTFNEENPFCIPRHKFCDGETECANGADEKQVGHGFKCMVKDQHTACLLPDAMVCDAHFDCEDKSDECETNSSAASANASKGIPLGSFECLDQSASIFQRQVCDGVVDCPDLSDECLCGQPRSRAINKLCGSVCWRHIWTDGDNGHNGCAVCQEGEIPTDWFADSVQRHPVSCVSVKYLCSGDARNYTSYEAEVCGKSTQADESRLKCLSIDGTFRFIMARKCDGRPECFFGEDECVPECTPAAVAPLSNNSFCSLFVSDFGFRCMNEDIFTSPTVCFREPRFDYYYWPDAKRGCVFGNRATSDDGFPIAVRPCDGKADCKSGSDEAHCPSRLPCLSSDNDETGSGSGPDSGTYDSLEMCDGIFHCLNGADESPNLCAVKRNKTCDPSQQDCSVLATDCPNFVDFDGVADPFPDLEELDNNSTTASAILQYGVLILTACGAVGNSYAFVLAIANSIVVLHHKREGKSFSTARFFQESIMFTTLSAAKLIFCVCVAITHLHNQRQRNVDKNCAEALEWRLSAPCEILGVVTFVSVAVVWLLLVLCSFALITAVCLKRVCQLPSAAQSRDKRCCGWFAARSDCWLWLISGACFVFIWAPLLIVALTVTRRTESHAWVQVTGAADDVFGNILDHRAARVFADKAATMTGLPAAEKYGVDFTWLQFSEIVSTAAPQLGVDVLGVFGYYSYSETCMPMFLVRPVAGPSPSGSFSLALMIAVCACALLLLVSMMLFLIFSGKPLQPKNRSPQRNADDANWAVHVIAFALVEVLTWIPIVAMYLLGSKWGPVAISSYAYRAAALGLLVVNCGIVAVFLHVRKRRVVFRTCSSQEGEDPDLVNPLTEKSSNRDNAVVVSDLSGRSPLRRTSDV